MMMVDFKIYLLYHLHPGQVCPPLCHSGPWAKQLSINVSHWYLTVVIMMPDLSAECPPFPSCGCLLKPVNNQPHASDKYCGSKIYLTLGSGAMKTLPIANRIGNLYKYKKRPADNHSLSQRDQVRWRRCPCQGWGTRSHTSTVWSSYMTCPRQTPQTPVM